MSGWWNLVQFRRWWEWAGDRILIWTFKNKVYTSHAGGGLRRGGGCDDIPREILLRTFKLSKNKCLEELPLFGFHLNIKIKIKIMFYYLIIKGCMDLGWHVCVSLGATPLIQLYKDKFIYWITFPTSSPPKHKRACPYWAPLPTQSPYKHRWWMLW